MNKQNSSHLVIHTFYSCLLLSLFFTSPSLATEKFHTPGVYAGENGALISVASGRISTAFEAVRAQRLAREQALRNARYQLAKHVYKDTLSGPRKYSVQIQGAQVIYESQQGNLIFVALQAHPKNVHIVEQSPLVEFQKVAVAPLVELLLTKAPALADGGANIFDIETGWVGLGVGYAALPEVMQEGDRAKAKTIARMAANEALTSFIFGAQVTTNFEQHELYAQGTGADAFKSWVKNTSREEITGTLQGAQMVGEWVAEGNLVGVAVVVAQPALDFGLQQEDSELLSEAALLYKSDIALDWQRVIVARPWIQEGGVSLCKHQDKLYALAVESGTLQNNETYNRVQLPVLIDVKARNQITRFLLGLSSNTTTYSEEIQRTNLQSTEVTQHLHKVSSEGTAGVVSQIQRLGNWYSQDEKKLFQAFIVPLP